MKWFSSRLLWGSLLIVGGLVFLLENMGVFKAGGYVWSIAFVVAGVGFLSVYLGERQQWWPLIPGVALLAVGAALLLDTAFPTQELDYAGLLILGGIGLAFLLVFLANREQWWALIPGGVLVTLAVVSFIADTVTGLDTGGVFFLGLGTTFLLVGLVKTPQGQLKWAFIPGGIMLLMAFIIFASSGQYMSLILPIAAILFGAFLIYRTVFARRAP